MNTAAKGALAGLAATVPMTVAMEILWRRLPRHERYPLPPREIIDCVLPARIGAVLGERGCRNATICAHFSYGAAVGALFPLITASRGPLSGAAYGVGIWAASYQGWIPALRILKPAFRHPPRRNALMIAVHLIWGASLAISLRELDRMDRDRPARLARPARPGGVHPDPGSPP